MRSGWLGGIAAVLIATAAPGHGEGAVAVNGRVLSLSPAPRSEGGATWVPVSSFAPLIGIDAIESDGAVSLRWSGGRDELATAELRTVAGVRYASLDGLVRRVGGTVRHEGGSVWVEAPVAHLFELSGDIDGLVVRLDRFAPTSVTSLYGIHVVRLSNCRVSAVQTSVAFGPGDVGRATVIATDGLSCEVRVSFLEEAALALRCSDVGGAYSLLLTPSDTPMTISTATLDDGFTCVEGWISVGTTTADVVCVRIDAWRSRATVRPILPVAGPETASLEEVTATAGAALAIAARSGAPPGVVVIDGVPRFLATEPCWVLSSDAFGMLVPLFSAFAASAATPFGRISLDGIGRPIGYDELVGYASGYAGGIATGFPDRFRVVRVRDGVVVSILDEPFVVADPTATLLVASGAARERLADLALGDRVDVVCETIPERRAMTAALSVDGLLLWNGSPAVSSSSWSPAATWSLAGIDWQGGLFFLSVAGEAELSVDAVLSILALLPVPPRDVAVLERGGTGALELALENHHAHWGDRDAILVGLGAILK